MSEPCIPKQQRHFKNSATHLAGVVIAVGGRFAARREVGSREPVSRPRARRDVVVRAFHRQRRSSAGQRVCSASAKPDQPLRASDRSTRRRVLVQVLPPGSRQSEAAGGRRSGAAGDVSALVESVNVTRGVDTMGSGADADGWCDLGELEDAAKVRSGAGVPSFFHPARRRSPSVSPSLVAASDQTFNPTSRARRRDSRCCISWTPRGCRVPGTR